MYAAIITLSWRKPRNAGQQEEEEILRACLRRTEGIQQKQETKKPIRSRSTPSNLKESWQRDDVLAFSQSFPELLHLTGDPRKAQLGETKSNPRSTNSRPRKPDPRTLSHGVERSRRPYTPCGDCSSSREREEHHYLSPHLSQIL
jgi:hypothetical protein